MKDETKQQSGFSLLASVNLSDGALPSRNSFRCCGCGKPNSERIEFDCAETKTFWHHACWRVFIEYVGVKR